MPTIKGEETTISPTHSHTFTWKETEFGRGEWQKATQFPRKMKTAHKTCIVCVQELICAYWKKKYRLIAFIAMFITCIHSIPPMNWRFLRGFSSLFNFQAVRVIFLHVLFFSLGLSLYHNFQMYNKFMSKNAFKFDREKKSSQMNSIFEREKRKKAITTTAAIATTKMTGIELDFAWATVWLPF